MARRTGIQVRVGKGGAKTYRAEVYSAADGKKIRKSFPTEAAARQWRADAYAALSRGGLRAPAPTTLAEAAEAWLAGARTGAVLNRSQESYKPSALRGYERALRQHLLPAFGARKLADLTAGDVQALVDRLHGGGMDASTLRNALMPLRAIYRHAARPGGPVLNNPTRGLQLPAVRAGATASPPPRRPPGCSGCCRASTTAPSGRARSTGASASGSSSPCAGTTLTSPAAPYRCSERTTP